MPEGGAKKIRLFFALWPDEALRETLAEAAGPLRAACDGRPVPKSNYHLTLAFLGGVEASRLDGIRDAAAGVAAGFAAGFGTPGFELVLDTAGHWRRAGVAWLGARRPPEAAEQLAGFLWQALEPLGFAAEQRPFRPHLTVLRGCRRCVEVGPVAPVAWPVRDFVLVRSETRPEGARYEIVGRWGLARESGGSGRK